MNTLKIWLRKSSWIELSSKFSQFDKIEMWQSRTQEKGKSLAQH